MQPAETSKHTPGPWRIRQSYADQTYTHVYSDTDDRIACTRSEANARLIAAAPETAAERDRLKEINAELLAALETLVKLHLRHTESTIEELLAIKAEDVKAAWSQGIAAIAKARGEG